ncbi:MAG TPA: NAD(P)-binding oxidoreductase [Polyangiales bacterium]
MTTLVLGASGATGRLLVQQLLARGERVKAVVRSQHNLPESVASDDKLTIVRASILELSDAQLAELVRDCTAIASCLGHNLTLRGIFGPPKRLVTDAMKRLCAAAQAHCTASTVRVVLMNTTGNRNRDLPEPLALRDRLVLGLIRATVPPHADNEEAADYLRTTIGQRHPKLEWCAVRPDTLFDSPVVDAYDVHPSPTRSAVFDPGKTSRIQVAHFMATLITEPAAWNQWKGKMPVIYDRAS